MHLFWKMQTFLPFWGALSPATDSMPLVTVECVEEQRTPCWVTLPWLRAAFTMYSNEPAAGM